MPKKNGPVKHFAARELGGKWYVYHVRTGRILPASPGRTWYENADAAQKVAL